MPSDRIYLYPILEVTDDEPNEKQLHKTLKALRELYNSRNTTDTSLKYGELDGWGFGLTGLKFLLNRSACQKTSNYTHEDVDRKCHEASTAGDNGIQMMHFVHWATETYMDFLYRDPKLQAERASWGLEMMRPAKKRLQEYTSEVHHIIQRDDRTIEVDHKLRLMLEMLHEMFDHINEHHKWVSDSRVGVEKILLLGKETDFFRRGLGITENTQRLFSELERHRMPMFKCLEAVEQVIERQLKEQEHRMPVEYAVHTMATVIPELSQATLQAVPLRTWSDWLQDLDLNSAKDVLVSNVREKLADIQQPKSSLKEGSSPSMEGDTLSAQATPTQSTGAIITKQLQVYFDQEASPKSSFNSLFDSPSKPARSPQPGPLAHVDQPGNIMRKKLSLPGYKSGPWPGLQHRISKDEGSSSQTSRQQPSKSATTKPTAHTIAGISRPTNDAKEASLLPTSAQRLQNDLFRARTPAKAAPEAATTPAISDNGSESTNQATPTGQKKMLRKPGLTDKVKRLQDARPQVITPNKKQVLSPMARIEEEASAGSSVVDRDGDSRMGDETEAEISEEE